MWLSDSVFSIDGSVLMIDSLQPGAVFHQCAKAGPYGQDYGYHYGACCNIYPDCSLLKMYFKTIMVLIF